MTFINITKENENENVKSSFTISDDAFHVI